MGDVRIPGPRRPDGGGVGWPSARWSYFGGTLDDVRRLRDWCGSEPGLRGPRGYWVRLVASELATNAVLHTATGEKYGWMGASIEVCDGRAILCVLDQGTKAGLPASVPRVKAQGFDDLCAGGRGLGLVDRIAEHWWWEGEHGFPVELWAIIPLDRDPSN